MSLFLIRLFLLPNGVQPLLSGSLRYSKSTWLMGIFLSCLETGRDKMPEITPNDSAVSGFLLLLHFTSPIASDVVKGTYPGMEIGRLSLRHPGASGKGLTLGAEGVPDEEGGVHLGHCDKRGWKPSMDRGLTPGSIFRCE